MKLFLLKPRGFCAGVVRAIETVERALKIWGPPIYVNHQIVHNNHVVKDLEKKGAIFLEDLDQIPKKSRVIYSAHGVAPAQRALAKKRDLIEIDASCGLVIRIHSAVKRYVKKGYHILLIGHKTHVEVIGTKGQAPDQTTVIESVCDVEKLKFPPDQKLFYIMQTTLSLDDVGHITKALLKKYPHAETLNSSSICFATTNRQLALRAVVNCIDLILVVGDPMSSNSNRLREIGEKREVPSYLINSPEEIDPRWLDTVSSIALTAGASTPESVVERCIETLQSLGVKEVEETEYTKENVFFQLPKEVLNAT